MLHPIHDYDEETNTATLTVYGTDTVTYRYRNGKVEELNLTEDELEIVNATRHLCLHVPKRVDTDLTIRDAVEQVRDILVRKVSFKDVEDEWLVATWIVSAHFFPVFDTFPILYIGKPGHAQGGTVLLSLVLALSPRPVLYIAPTEAAMFRTATIARPTIGIDEVRSDLPQTMLKKILTLVDGGFHKNVKIPRASGRAIELYDVYCPKVIVDPVGTIEKASTLSRGVRIGLRRGTRLEVPDVKRYYRENAELVDSLYGMYFSYLETVRETYLNILSQGSQLGLSGRGLQAYAPLLAIAKLAGESIYSTVLDGVKRLDAEQLAMLDPTTFALLSIASILRQVAEGEREIPRLVHTSLREDKVKIDLYTLCREANREVRELFGRRVLPQQVEHFLRHGLPRDRYSIALENGRKYIIAQGTNTKEILLDLAKTIEKLLIKPT